MNRGVIVDDEPGVLNALTRSLRREGWALRTFDDPEQALTVASTETIDLVICDYRMPTMDGVTFLKAFRAVQSDTFRPGGL